MFVNRKEFDKEFGKLMKYFSDSNLTKIEMRILMGAIVELDNFDFTTEWMEKNIDLIKEKLGR